MQISPTGMPRIGDSSRTRECPETERLCSSECFFRSRSHWGHLQLGFIETPHVPVGLQSHLVQEDELLVAIGPRLEWRHEGTSAVCKNG